MLGGKLEGRLGVGLQRGLQSGLLTGHGKVRSRSGSVYKFNSFELDSEVGRLVFSFQLQFAKYAWRLHICKDSYVVFMGMTWQF